MVLFSYNIEASLKYALWQNCQLCLNILQQGKYLPEYPLGILSLAHKNRLSWQYLPNLCCQALMWKKRKRLGVQYLAEANLKAVEFSTLKPCLHWQSLHDNASDSDSHHILALATLGDMTQIGLFLFLVTSPKVAKASTVASPKVTVACHCCWQFC